MPTSEVFFMSILALNQGTKLERSVATGAQS